MKYCQQCGTQLPDNARFCRSCGAEVPQKVSARTSDDEEGIVIDAPEDATVTISSGPDGTKAPDSDGEFFIASWGGTEAVEPQEVQRPKRARVSPPRQDAPRKQQPPRMQQPPRVEEPEEPEEVYVEEPEEDSGSFSKIMKYGKILVIVVCIIASFVLVKGFFKSDAPEASKQEQMEEYFQQPVQSTTNVEDVQNVQEVQEVSGDETTQEFVTNDPTNNNTGEDEVIFEADDDPHSGFGIIDDMPLPERAEYLQNLLANSERYLREELAKGDDADQGIISQLRRHIAKLRERLSQFKQ